LALLLLCAAAALSISLGYLLAYKGLLGRSFLPQVNAYILLGKFPSGVQLSSFHDQQIYLCSSSNDQKGGRGVCMPTSCLVRANSQQGASWGRQHSKVTVSGSACH
jgi:hypothetical protein